MGRSRWRVLAFAALLVTTAKHIACQDENDFYYTPVERNFAQVQPPLFPNNRPATYFEHTDGFRVAQAGLVNAPQQHLYNEAHGVFPSPNYNQHPSPFQIANGKSQSGNQFFMGQPDFTVTPRQRFRPSLPQNYQLVHPASSRKPDIPQIHSVAYQNDPSKPETFLGQVTLNNPDIDFLQNNRFKNTPFNGNSIKNVNQHNHGIPIDVEEDDDQDLFDPHRVTTYNPTKLSGRQRINVKPSFEPVRQYEPKLTHDSNSFSYLTNKSSLGITPSITTYRNNKNFHSTPTPQSKKSVFGKYNENAQKGESTDYKTLHDIEPLLEDDISDLNTFRELMKNNHESLDVQVIKSGGEDTKQNLEKYDSNPSASSMDMSNVSKELPQKLNITSATKSTEYVKEVEENKFHPRNKTDENIEHHKEQFEERHLDEVEDDNEYVEYYDDGENTEIEHTTRRHTTTDHPDIYDEYDTTEEYVHPEEEIKPNVTKSFEVLTLKPNNTMMKDDNFRDFVDTTVIDNTEELTTHNFSKDNFEFITTEEITTIDTPSILSQEVVSVVTTKSVINGTISIPEVTYGSSTKDPTISSEINSSSEQINSETYKNAVSSTENPFTNTTENWIVVASVQTSRSVSGARFLPFPTVEQEEKKQILTESDDDDNNDTVTKNPKEENDRYQTKHFNISSVENINDKLDSIQSELSSAVLEGSLDDDNKNITLITEPTEKTIPTTTTPGTLNVFTLKSIQNPPTTEKSSPDPLPVHIKKFTPRVTTSTTPKPKRKPALVTVMDDLSGLLPPGYKPRPSFKDKRISTTTTTPTTLRMPLITSNEDDLINGTQGRSSGINSKNKVIVTDEKSLLPKDYRLKEISKQREELFQHVKEDDLSKFLPPGFKITTTEKPTNENRTTDSTLSKINKVDITAFLPKDYKESAEKTDKVPDVSKLFVNAAPVDISAFLPPGFKLNESKSSNSNNNSISNNATDKINIADMSNLLPPGFHLNKSEESSPDAGTIPKSVSNGFKVVFPSRPGSKPTRKITTPKPNIGSGLNPITPKIQKGWPIRASTEFTGWPSPSTTPFSIEKLLDAQRNATATTRLPELSTEATTRRLTTTSTTTPLPLPSTTPGVCRHECDLAATIKIVAGAKWVPELLDHHTREWQNLAKDVKEELNSVYSKSGYLKKWYKDIRIDAFSKGSVLVDYFIELNKVEERIDTLELKKLFHKSLAEAKPGTVVETITEAPDNTFDPDVMLGDQPEDDRMKKSNEKMTKVIDKSTGKLEIGKFVMDPAYTEFIVLPKREEPTVVQPDQESFLPQWGIAVIVIALASLLFVVIFGVTVLVNRQKSAKAKQPIPLSEDMLRELDKSHMGGFDDMHQLKERELPYLPSGKRMSTAFIEQLAYPNAGDSWRSEWTPQLQKYMQHYTPDSGRGSQIYGAAGNLYGYTGSQVYGQTGGGGSQVYGYTGDYPRSHHSRRRSDYDSNF